MTETQERFLRTVLTRVPLDSVVELHLFPPIRRGTLETGVAVIATVLPPAPLTVVDGEAAVEALIEAAIDEVAAEEVSDAEIVIEVDIEADIEATSADESELGSTEADDAADVTDVTAELASVDVSIEEAQAEIVSEADDELADNDDTEPTGEDADDLGDEIGVITIAPPAPSPRMRILTASYRHTIKGVERGKWTVDVQEEADAPLEAVELVLRGVRHRSTEPADPELVTHDALMALLTPAAVAPAA